MDRKVESFLARLEGVVVTRVEAMFAGVHVHFGPLVYRSHYGRERGTFLLWIQTGLGVVQNKGVLLAASFPEEAESEVLRTLIEQKPVLRAGFDQKNNSLRLLFDEEMLLSVYPGTREEALFWSLFDNSVSPSEILVVCSESIRFHQ